jgi:nucleotide-binding universal stress UspA family protein
MYQLVVVPLDGSKLAESVLPHVESLAKSGQAKSIVFVRVPEPMFPLGTYDGFITAHEVRQIQDRSKEAAETYLKDLTSKLNYGEVKIQTAVLAGNIAESIADYASKNNADLIIIATHGRSGVGRWVWGSVADRILRSACIPVLMVRAPGCVPGVTD